MCASGLTALPREVAAGSVVLELTDDHVLLRARSRMLLTPDVVHLIEAAMNHHRVIGNPDLEEILETEAETYEFIRHL